MAAKPTRRSAILTLFNTLEPFLDLNNQQCNNLQVDLTEITQRTNGLTCYEIERLTNAILRAIHLGQQHPNQKLPKLPPLLPPVNLINRARFFKG